MAEVAEADTTLPQQAVQLCDVSNLARYLRRAIPPLLDEADDGESAAENVFTKCVNDKVSQESMRKFISDPQTLALLVQKEIQKGRYTNMHLFAILCRKLLTKNSIT